MRGHPAVKISGYRRLFVLRSISPIPKDLSFSILTLRIRLLVIARTRISIYKVLILLSRFVFPTFAVSRRFFLVMQTRSILLPRARRAREIDSYHACVSCEYFRPQSASTH